jgi:ubiquinone/menaquinone biosynthesis C-methylase UbiE
VFENLMGRITRRLRRSKPVDEAPLIAALERSPAEAALPMPPADIRYRIVSDALGEYDFLRVGIEARRSIEEAIAATGTRIEELGSVLDWGAGCSRIMRQWAPLFGQVSFTGTDIDQVMIDWDVANIPGPRFAVNGAEPPLPCGDEEFDLVYGASVFTHLDEAMQQRWLAELVRVLKPGGILLLSTHGPYVFELSRHTFSDDDVAAFRDCGFVFIRNIVDGVLPDWYQSTFQTGDHVHRTFAPHVDVIDHVARGMTGYQDLAICRKPRA